MNSRAFSSYVTSKRLISPHLNTSNTKSSNHSAPSSSSIFNLFNGTNSSTSKVESSIKKTDINLYTILGVSKHSSDKEIKSAYKSLSKQYHPDLNPNGEVKFRTINEAYKVLMDPVKRKLYDSKFINDNITYRPIIKFDSSLDIQHTIYLKESDLKTGKKKKFMINRKVICKECENNNEDSCTNCNGTRFNTISEVVRVTIEPGMKNGQLILVSGKGDENLKVESRNIVHYLGNLVFTVSASS